MKSDSKMTHFGMAFPKVSLNIHVCFHIEWKSSGGVHIQFFFTFKTTGYVFAGYIKNNYTVYWWRCAEPCNKTVFFPCAYIICYEIFLITMKIFSQDCDAKLKEQILKVFRDHDAKLKQQKRTDKIEFWCVNVHDLAKSDEIQWALSVLYYRSLREDMETR